MSQHDVAVVIVGGGPVGLTLAGRLGQRDIPVVVVEVHERGHGEGSKALCMQRETLEVWGRLGIGGAVADRGVSWNVGRTYFRRRELFVRRLPQEPDDHYPAFVNISQTDVEHLLIEAVEKAASVKVLWRSEAVGLTQDRDGVTVEVRSADGSTRSLRACYVVGADGVRSGVRKILGVDFPGHSFHDLFLIADIRADLAFPNERRFFFDPPFNPGRQVLIHPQPDSVWRIDWQVPGDCDVEEERRSGRLDERIRAVVGSADYELAWLTAYTFQQRLADRFRVGRVLLAGDSSHVMSPFGARGLNSGVADAENLAWKLRAALAGFGAADGLLESYHDERRAAAAENLRVTGETMAFMVPKPGIDRVRRDAILRASQRIARLRARVNSGRLAEPFVYPPSSWIEGCDLVPGAAGRVVVGGIVPDVACEVVRGLPEASDLTGSGAALPGFRVRRLKDLVGHGFLVLAGAGLPEVPGATVVTLGAEAVGGAIALKAPEGALRERFGDPIAGGRAVIVRPDGHVSAAVEPSPAAIAAALRRSGG